MMEIRLTECRCLRIEELQQYVLKDRQRGSREGAGRHRAFLVHHLRLTAPLQSNRRQADNMK